MTESGRTPPSPPAHPSSPQEVETEQLPTDTTGWNADERNADKLGEGAEIDRKRWQQVQDIVLDALDLPFDGRGAFVREACGDDGALLSEVQSLLDADDTTLRRVDASPVEGLTLPAAEIENGDWIGPYQVQSELGRGGIGAVYLAVRADGEFRRTVAVKVLKRGMDTSEIVRRFRNERQILANLRHPNIAELYDGGTTADDRPYLVMEHVEGAPIDRYCDRHRLSVSRRIALFLKVCSAVQLAHRNLVVHRDLKPGNILVDDADEPKLLDFGIAKLLESRSTIESTATGLRPMTPHYASPEQVLGEPITTASDVYSLGVVLYELLTGRCPYRPRTGEAEILQAICEQDPTKPSRAVTQQVSRAIADGREVLSPEEISRARGLDPRRLARRLSGDLDDIVRKALRKEPEHRYSSVEALAMDLRRHRDGLPVAARRGTFFYRTSKLLRRRRKELTAAALVLALLAAFVIDRDRQQRRTAEERDRAVQVSKFLGDLLAIDRLREAKGANLTLREVLDHGREEVTDKLRDQPELQAELFERLSDGYGRLGFFEEALELQEKVLELIQILHGQRHPEIPAVLVKLSELHGSLGRYEAAERLKRRALAMTKELTGADSRETNSMLNALAASLLDQGRYAEAEPLFRESLAMIQEYNGATVKDIAAIEGNLAILLYLKGDYEEAETRLRGVLERSAPVLGEAHPQISSHRYHLATLLHFQRHHEEAKILLQGVLRVRYEYSEEGLAPARALSRLASVERALGALDTAEELERDALARRRRFVGPGHPWVGESLLGLAETLLARGGTGAVGAAEEHAREALDAYQKSFPGGHWSIAHAHTVLAACLAERGQVDAAEELLAASTPILEEQRGARSPAARAARGRLDTLRRPADRRAGS